jgi:hypothetical protein
MKRERRDLLPRRQHRGGPPRPCCPSGAIRHWAPQPGGLECVSPGNPRLPPCPARGARRRARATDYPGAHGVILHERANGADTRAREVPARVRGVRRGGAGHVLGAGARGEVRSRATSRDARTASRGRAFEALLLHAPSDISRRGVDSLVLDDICPLDHRFAAAEDGSGPESDHGECAARQRKGESTSTEGDRV